MLSKSSIRSYEINRHLYKNRENCRCVFLRLDFAGLFVNPVFCRQNRGRKTEKKFVVSLIHTCKGEEEDFRAKRENTLDLDKGAGKYN